MNTQKTGKCQGTKQWALESKESQRNFQEINSKIWDKHRRKDKKYRRAIQEIQHLTHKASKREERGKVKLKM